MFAVIDIGSNTVRLIIYEVDGTFPVIQFTEKVVCELGKEVHKTKLLRNKGKEKVVLSLDRFIKIVRNMENNVKLFVSATAAIRISSNGKEFVKFLEKRYDINIRILSGKEEAQYSAMGVAGSMHNAKGIVMDVGGGSVELSYLDGKGNISHECSIPVGGLISSSFVKIRQCVQQEIEKYDFYKNNVGLIEDIYTIGGGVRSIAKIHMARVGHNIKILHGYEVLAYSINKTINYILGASKDELESLNIIGNKRINTIFSSACIVKVLLDYLQVKRVFFSNAGLRDGIVFEELGIDVCKDNLLLGCKQFMDRKNSYQGDALYNWIINIVEPIIKEELYNDQLYNSLFRMIKAGCFLTDAGLGYYGDSRARYALFAIMDYPFIHMNHYERMILSLIMYFRYKLVLSDEIKDYIGNILNKREIRCVRLIGYLLRMVYNLTLGNLNLLSKIKLLIEKDVLVLYITKELYEVAQGVFVKELGNSIAEILKINYNTKEM